MRIVLSISIYTVCCIYRCNLAMLAKCLCVPFQIEYRVYSTCDEMEIDLPHVLYDPTDDSNKCNDWDEESR